FSFFSLSLLRCAPHLLLSLFSLRLPRQPRSPLFPYTTLFRSNRRGQMVRQSGLYYGCGRLCCGYGKSLAFSYAGRRKRRRSLCRSEEHTSELQSRFDLVCRLLLEKKKDRVV